MREIDQTGRPTLPEPKIVTTAGWQPPFAASEYTIELGGIFRATDGTDLKIGRMTTITRDVLHRASFDAAEYVRKQMGKQLRESVRAETGQLWSVGEPVRYRLRDDRDPDNPRHIDLPWTWERGEA